MAAGTKVQQGTLLKERRQMAATRRGKAVLDCGRPIGSMGASGHDEAELQAQMPLGGADEELRC